MELSHIPDPKEYFTTNDAYPDNDFFCDCDD